VGLGAADADKGDDRDRDGCESDATESDLPLAHAGSFPDLGTFVTA
jgi:hypothetical protein